MTGIDELANLVKKSLSQIMEWSGLAVPEITDDTRPLEDLQGFDSQNAVELLADLQAMLELDYIIPEDIFISKKRNQFFSVIQIARGLHEFLAKKR